MIYATVIKYAVIVIAILSVICYVWFKFERVKALEKEVAAQKVEIELLSKNDKANQERMKALDGIIIKVDEYKTEIDAMTIALGKKSKAVDDVLVKLKAETDPEKKKALYVQYYKLLWGK